MTGCKYDMTVGTMQYKSCTSREGVKGSGVGSGDESVNRRHLMGASCTSSSVIAVGAVLL